jgi:hypothetical protein
MESSEFSYTKKFEGRNVPIRLRVVHTLRMITLLPLFVIEWRALVGLQRPKSNKIPLLLADITNSTLGKGLEIFDTFVCRLRKKQTKKFDENILLLDTPSGNKLERDQISLLINHLRLKGVSQISGFLSESQVSEILKKLEKSPGKGTESLTVFNSQNTWMLDPNSGPRFDVLQHTLQEISQLNDIGKNGTLLKIARDYLNCAPLLSSIQIWTTRRPESSSPKSLENAAMAFHCDADYFGFIKFFILLNKVDLDNGPFTFVEKSHRGKRHIAGRVKDRSVVNEYDTLFYGTGNPGDLVIADTKGWHKAMPPRSGHRTILQLVFASSFFG